MHGSCYNIQAVTKMKIKCDEPTITHRVSNRVPACELNVYQPCGTNELIVRIWRASEKLCLEKCQNQVNFSNFEATKKKITVIFNERDNMLAR